MAYFSLKIISMVKNYARDAKHSISLTLQFILLTKTIPIQAPPLTLYQLHDVFFIQLKDDACILCNEILRIFLHNLVGKFEEEGRTDECVFA